MKSENTTYQSRIAFGYSLSGFCVIVNDRVCQQTDKDDRKQVVNGFDVFAVFEPIGQGSISYFELFFDWFLAFTKKARES